MNYIVGVLVVATGVFFGFLANDVNEILQWIVGGLYGGYVAANCLNGIGGGLTPMVFFGVWRWVS
jgi:hypothetical protein